ncbi:hypothetical protein BU24DRAFT_432007 [Aaosphaeria arxii CBS 175.79]|uniref:Uncharacterized protein n=1 Tax=Aaosphaeria arxii CBS 175.79 TaxID=1450172 RepID=A0A6A5XWY1_9PLEO|nr:uncharacterized protein BU24DRAFT_432007 [Aaosphaeria arxii CBS 175.79]KAF2017211.1 hypothetical protein BU24DRAFT_432007 [Aaosphaeria arxii CBS 175.79]
MAPRCFQYAALAITLLKFATAQDSIPADLSQGFRSGTGVQVSYEGEAENGFSDGETFEKDAVGQVPSFALGGSTGVAPRNRYTILMVDTTCDEARKLHYARTNFKTIFEFTRIESETEPVLSYKAPGAFQETGDDRKYTFLMYGQPSNKEISELKLPEEGAIFDAKKFEEDNGFQEPQAGVGMVVKLGGESSCNGGTTPGNPVESSVPATSAATSAAPTSAASVATSAASVVDSTIAQGSSAVATPTGSSTTRNGTIPVPSSRTNGASIATSASGLLTSLVPTSRINGSAPGVVTSTLFLTSNPVPEATETGAGAGAGTSTSTADPALQSVNSASGLSVGVKGCGFTLAMMAAVGLLA